MTAIEGAEPALEEVERVVGRPSSIVEKRCVLNRFQRQRAKLVTRRQSTEILADVLCDDVERSVMQPFQPLSRRQKRWCGVEANSRLAGGRGRIGALSGIE